MRLKVLNILIHDSFECQPSGAPVDGLTALRIHEKSLRSPAPKRALTDFQFQRYPNMMQSYWKSDTHRKNCHPRIPCQIPGSYRIVMATASQPATATGPSSHCGFGMGNAASEPRSWSNSRGMSLDTSGAADGRGKPQMEDSQNSWFMANIWLIYGLHMVNIWLRYGYPLMAIPQNGWFNGL